MIKILVDSNQYDLDAFIDAFELYKYICKEQL